MWANSVWGLFGFGVTFALARLSMLWTTGHQWIAPWLTGASGFCILMAVLVLLWPFVFHRNKGSSSVGNNIGTIQNNTGIITQGQSGGINAITIHHEDKSPKRRFRDLFNLIDPRIVPEVASGKKDLTVRLQPHEIDQLNTLIAEAGTPEIVLMAGFGRRFLGSQISNGSLGTQAAVADQVEVRLSFKVDSFD